MISKNQFFHYSDSGLPDGLFSAQKQDRGTEHEARSWNVDLFVDIVIALVWPFFVLHFLHVILIPFLLYDFFQKPEFKTATICQFFDHDDFFVADPRGLEIILSVMKFSVPALSLEEPVALQSF